MQTIAIFCGSSAGTNPQYAETARQVGTLLAERNIELVFGGGKVGIMGIIADAVLAGGGRVTGVIPDFLYTKEIAHAGVSELIVVKTMHERKGIMYERADGIIALPGGFGTLDELFETLTWGQLGLHQKPVGLLNINGYFNQLLGFLDHLHTESFVNLQNRNMLLDDTDIPQLLTKMEGYKAPNVPKWLNREGL